jgi:hypothetical protein
MALVNKNIFDLNGKLGNVIFRTRNGKLVAYAAPNNHRISKSQKSVDNRKKFGINVQLSKNICSLTPLYNVWKNSKLEGSNTYTKILKYNYKSCVPGSLTLNNSLTPISIALDVTSITIANGILNIEFQIPNLDNNNLISPFYINIIVFLSETNEVQKGKGTQLISFNVPILQKEESGIYSFLYSFDKATRANIESYSKCNVYFALVKIQDFEDNPVWSSSYSAEVPLA